MTIPPSPFSEEYSSQPLPEGVIDRVQDDSWGDFYDATIQAEQAMIGYDPDNEASVQAAIARATELGESFGWEYHGKRTRVLGLAYEESAINNPEVSEPTIFDASSVAFHGIDVHYINGRWQSVLEFYVAEHTDDLAHGFYYVPPNKHHLMELRIDLASNEDDGDEPSVVEMLEQQADAARACAAGDYFAAMMPADQREILRSIVDSADSDIPRELRGQAVVVAGLKYYTSYDDMSGFDLRDFYTDLTDIKAEERTSLVGFVEGFEYLELRNLPEELQLRASHFTFNDGAPCLVLRDQEHRRTHYILPQSILDIV